MTNGSIDIDDRHGDVSGVVKDLSKIHTHLIFHNLLYRMLRLRQYRYLFVSWAELDLN